MWGGVCGDRGGLSSYFQVSEDDLLVVRVSATAKAKKHLATVIARTSSSVLCTATVAYCDGSGTRVVALWRAEGAFSSHTHTARADHTVRADTTWVCLLQVNLIGTR